MKTYGRRSERQKMELNQRKKGEKMIEQEIKRRRKNQTVGSGGGKYREKEMN